MKAQHLVRLLGTVGLMTVGAMAVAGMAIAAPAAPQSAPGSLAAAPTSARPVWVRKADRGFFDDPIAVHPSLGLIALIRTDSASFANIELFDLNKKTKVAGYPLGDAQQIFERIEFTGADKSLVIVVKDGKTGLRSAQRFDAAGNPSGLLGPATAIGFTTRNEQRLLVRWDRVPGQVANKQSKPAKSATSTGQVIVSLHDLNDFSLVGKAKVLATDAAGNLIKPSINVLSWFDGYTQLLGQEAGEQDNAKDSRLPPRVVIYDVLRSDVISRMDLKDLVGWSTVEQLRRRRPGRSAFAHIPEDESQLQVVDALGTRAPLSLAVPFEMYDLRSLIERESFSEGNLVFSLTVDPMNPEALTRKKADVTKLDLYRVPLPAPGSLQAGIATAAEHLVRVPMDDRPVAWSVVADWVVVVRKFKTFARGGEVVEIYRSK